jgi:hypothetical protein
MSSRPSSPSAAQPQVASQAAFQSSIIASVQASVTAAVKDSHAERSEVLQQLQAAQALNAFTDEVDKQQVAILVAIGTAKTAPEMKLLIQQVIVAKVSAEASGLTRFNEGKKIAKLFKGHASVPATALEDIVNACQEYRHGYRASRF